MTTRDPLETRVREALHRLMQVDPPRRAGAHPERPQLVRNLAVALIVLVTTSAVITGGFVLLHHPSSGAPPKPTPAVISLPPLEAVPFVPPQTQTPAPSYLPASGPACTPPDLDMRLGRQEGAGGNGVTYLIFTDRGAAACVLRGTPVVTFLGSDGTPLAVPAVTDMPGGMFPTLPNDGVGLIPLSDQGTSPGPYPEGGVSGQASLPLQYRDGCANSVAAVSVEVGGGRLVSQLTLPGAVPGPGIDCASVTGGGPFQVTVNPFQPAEYIN